MGIENYKKILHRKDGCAWVAEIPVIPACYACRPSREEALAELKKVFEIIAKEYRERGQALPADSVEIVNG